MITQDFLFSQMVEAEEIMNRERRAPGQLISDAFSKARRLHDEAEAAIRWMQEANLTEIEQVGPWGSKNIKRGDRVMIRKGAVIRTTHPRWNRDNPKVAGRDYAVEVHDVYEGYIQSNWHSHRRDEAVRNQQVVWAGTGGYWCWVDSKDVELI